MTISIATYGRSRRPWYNNGLIPQNAVFGTITQRYEYTTDPITGLTHKQLVSCNKIPFYCTNFVPTFKYNKYKGYNIPVYEIVVFDINNKRYIRTNTSACSDYYYIGEVLDNELNILGLYGRKVFPVAYCAKEVPCQERRVGEYMYKNGTYGYMCKTPDRTMTENDAIGDAYAQNRRFRK